MRDFLDALPDLLTRFDRNLMPAYQNRAGAEMWQWRTRWYAEHPEDAAGHHELQAVLRRVLDSGERADVEGAMPGTNGRRWFLTSVIPLRDDAGAITGVLTLSRDITERKRTEQALVESEARFRATFDQAAVGIAHVAPDGRFLRINQKLCEIVGYTREELTARTFQDITHKDDLEADLAYMRQMLAGTIPTYAMEKRYLHKNGGVVWVNLTVSLIRKADGSPDWFVAVIEDISARKHAEEQRHQLEEQLHSSQRLEAVGRLAGGVAHDFNNLLSVVLANADFALEAVRKGDPLFVDITEIRGAAERAALLTRQLLAFSRRQILEPEVVNLNHVIVGIEGMLRRLIGEDVVVTHELAADLGNVLADPGQIEQVIMNLAINARDAMPQGGRLTITTGNRTLDEAEASALAARPGPSVLLVITDNGGGMDSATRGRVFEPFFTTKEKGKGTGLGLSTVHGIVTQSGGAIEVESGPGTGTTFRILLPRVDATVKEAKRRPATPVAAGSETVLLVEDEEVVRRVIERVLKKAGYTVLSAGGGGDALLLCEQHPGRIDLVLTDVVMPHMSGRELVERLARMRPGMKVLYMSGYTDDAIVQHGVAQSAVRFVAKPFSAAELSGKVRAVLDEA
ncbi:MAG: PAS domain S-box protein [Deltaproteobacteria bacterium]|nr:PAS domain S-box protein [Deltaproteobacteria bacterium]